MEKVKLYGGAKAWQFTGSEENVAKLLELKLPTGEVVIQAEDEANGIEPRCYVPVSWGTHVLTVGDWIVLTDTGLVLTVMEKAKALILQTQTDKEQMFGVSQPTRKRTMRERAPLILAVDRVNTEAIVMLVEDAATEHRLDWTAIVHPVPEGEPARITLETNATGAVLGTFYEGEPVKIYADGQVMTL